MTDDPNKPAPPPLDGSPADAPINLSTGFRVERVEFPSGDATLVGRLFVPEGLDGKRPAVTFLGPETFVKEQAPTQYAKRLANDGFVALAFDPKYHGESGGEPRRWEDPAQKADDVRAAVAFLASRPEVDADRIAVMGVCQGSSAMLKAAADEPRIKAVVTAAGHYLDPEGDRLWLGGEDGFAARLERGKAAREKFEQAGDVDYVAAIDPESTEVAMPGAVVEAWYRPWADAGVWEDRYAVMSDASLLEFNATEASKRLQAPWLMIHSDNCFLPSAAKRVFEAAPGEKRMQWEGSTAHFRYYDDPVVIDRTAALVHDWFREHLDLPMPASAYIDAEMQSGPKPGDG